MDKTQIDKLFNIACTNAYRAYTQSIGCATLNQRLAFDKIKNPQPGDTVMEYSTIHDRSLDPVRIGILRNVSVEPCHEHDGKPIAECWNEEMDGPHECKQKYWYIELLDGTPYRWHNADFIRLFNGPWED